MKNLILVFLLMFTFGYFLADVTSHMIKSHSGRRNEIGRSYYSVLYKMKERLIYPIHNRDRIKSYSKGMNGVQVTQFRTGYKVKK
jgi:hypothetical protein